MNPSQYHPVEWFNINGVFKDIFKDDKNVHMINDTEAAYHDPEDLDSSINRPTFKLLPTGQVEVVKNNPFNISSGLTISKFTLLTSIKFKGDFRGAESYVMYKLMDIEIPYVRVGTTYYKITNSKNRWGGDISTLKTWKKETISDDHTKHILKLIPKYDDFIIQPDNKNYNRVYGNCYNLYSPFPHILPDRIVSISEIPYSMTVMKHIFGDKIDMGLTYMKVLYEHPRQMLPVLTLLSEERGTGKTTFGDWQYILFGENVTTVNPETLNSEFNSSYANRNILLFEEALVEKAAGVEKVKALTTAKMITYRDLYVSGVSIPFFGKIIFFTNKVHDFMKIDENENRFWILYVKPVNGNKNTKIDECLFKEAPLFLKYLSQLPPVDLTKDRLVFTPDQIKNEYLDNIKHESKTWLRKEIEIQLDRWFNENSGINEFKANLGEIREKILQGDRDVKLNYLKKVLKNEMKIPFCENERYSPFCDDLLTKTGATFTFQRNFSR